MVKNLVNCFNKEKKIKHFITVNEGSAVSLGIGYHLATKKIPLVYMQNAGLGNAINPLVSIAHKKVYSIPILLLIGWRGYPKVKDEPQHQVKGKITIKLLKNLLTHVNVKAVGECGLDYYRNYSSKKSQKIAFEGQIKLAIESKKPIFLHQRDAHNDFLKILSPFANKLNGGVAHCFTGDKDILKEYLDLGLHVGITGWICDDRRNADLQEAICKIPLDRLLIETDSPYLLPRTIKPKPSSRRNVPSNLHRIVDAISKYTGHSNQVIAEATFINAKKLFYL